MKADQPTGVDKRIRKVQVGTTWVPMGTTKVAARVAGVSKEATVVAGVSKEATRVAGETLGTTVGDDSKIISL